MILRVLTAALCFWFSPHLLAGALALEDEGPPKALPFSQYEGGENPLQEVEGTPAELMEAISEFIPSSKLACAGKILAQARFTETKLAGVDAESDNSVWLKNAGIVSDYQLKLKDSPCLATLIGKYYEDKDRFPNARSKKNKPDQVNGRPSLMAAAGEGTYKDTPKGFYFDKALELTAGDSLLATEIIGYCGHDDQNQNEVGLVNFNNKSTDHLEDYIKRKSYNAEEIVGNSLASDMVNFANNEEIKNIREKKFAYLNVKCPVDGSHFYAPGAVHPDLMLDKESIEKIASIQAPTKGAGVLPGKSYHANGASLISCRLKSCDLSDDKIERLQKLVAVFYRTKRIKDAQEKYSSIIRLMMKDFGPIFLKKENTEVLHSDEFAQKAEKWMNDNRDAIIKEGGGEFFSKNRAKMTWKEMLVGMDSSIGHGYLFSRPKASGYIEGNYDLDNDPSFNDCVKFIGHQRCTDVKEKYRTWYTDVEWTAKVQKLGSKFGSKNCPAGEQKLEERACTALDQLELRIGSCSQ